MRTHSIISSGSPRSGRTTHPVPAAGNGLLRACVALILFNAVLPHPRACAQAALFDFDNAPLHSSLPVDQTANGITARLSGTGQGYSIQEANVLGFTPQGFAGQILYPNSIFLADLLIRFDQALTGFSIMYACQELGCDDAATMRVTAYWSGTYVGTETKTASFPGTWPVDTLSCVFPQGFDSVVVHYESRPPTCQDYGVIYLADNMRVTPLSPTGVTEGEHPATFTLRQNYPNPFNPSTTITFSLTHHELVIVKVYNSLGQEVATLITSEQTAGEHSVVWNAGHLAGGVYYYRLQAGSFTEMKKLMLLR